MNPTYVIDDFFESFIHPFSVVGINSVCGPNSLVTEVENSVARIQVSILSSGLSIEHMCLPPFERA
jgi:hypothetical protein